jgi:hypothetical protein
LVSARLAVLAISVKRQNMFHVKHSQQHRSPLSQTGVTHNLPFAAPFNGKSHRKRAKSNYRIARQMGILSGL